MIVFLKKRSFFSVVALSLFCLGIGCQACSVPSRQMKDDTHFSHSQSVDSEETTWVPLSGKGLEEYMRPRFEDPNLQEKRELFQQAWSYYQRMEWEKASECFQKALEGYPYLKDYSTFFMAECDENQGKYKEAISRILEIIEKWPESPLIPRGCLKMADLYFCEADYQNAIEAYKKSLKMLTQENVYIHYQIGLANLEIGQCEAAMESFKTLLINEPDSEFTKVAQNHILRSQKEKGLEPLLLTPEENFKKAKILSKSRRYNEAIRVYESILHSEPDFPEKCQALYNLALCYKRIGNRDLSVKTLARIIEAIPEYECAPDARLLLARTLWNEHRSGDALEQLKFLRKNNPSWEKIPKVIYLMGRIAEEQDRFIEALDYYNLVTRVAPKGSLYRTAIWRIGWVYYLQGHYRQAVSHFDNFLTLTDDSAFRHQLLYWKARAEEKRGRIENAVQIYKMIIEEPYWSFYSGLSEIWLGNHDHPDQVDSNHPEDLWGGEDEILLILNEQERYVVTRLMELWLLGLREESVNEIRHLVYSTKRGTPELMFCLSTIAHMNGAHDLGIRIGILRSLSMKSENISLDKTEDLLLYPLGFLPLVQEKAGIYDIDPILIFSVIRQESLFDPVALSHSSAYGLMQIIPSTGNAIAKELGMDISSDLNQLFDPDVNLTFGCFFLKRLLDRFDQNMVFALASYNAGPGAVTSWQERFAHLDIDEFIESIPYNETRDYVKRIMKNYWIYSRIYTQLYVSGDGQQVKEAKSEEDSYR